MSRQNIQKLKFWKHWKTNGNASSVFMAKAWKCSSRCPFFPNPRRLRKKKITLSSFYLFRNRINPKHEKTYWLETRTTEESFRCAYNLDRPPPRPRLQQKPRTKQKNNLFTINLIKIPPLLLLSQSQRRDERMARNETPPENSTGRQKPEREKIIREATCFEHREA